MELRLPLVKVAVAGVLAVVLIAGMFALLLRHFEQQRQIEAAGKLVRQTADLFDKDEAFAEQGLPRDPWGNTLVVTIESGTINLCRVTSAGPDGLFNSPDDILAENRNANPQALGQQIGRGSTKLGIGVLKGIKQAVKAELKPKPDKQKD